MTTSGKMSRKSSYFKFLREFLYSYGYFQILKWYGVEIDVHDVKEYLKYILFHIYSLLYLTWISDICFYVRIAILTVANV